MGRWGQQHPDLAATARRDLGWPELRVLHVGVLTTADSRGYQPGNSYVCDGLIARLLWRSPPHLAELDVTGCTRLTAQAVFDAVGTAGSVANDHPPRKSRLHSADFFYISLSLDIFFSVCDGKHVCTRVSVKPQVEQVKS